MLGIIILIIGVSLLFMNFLSKRNSEGLVIAGTISSIVGCLMFAGFLFAGVYVYPDLVAQRHEIAVLKDRIEDVRSAAYPHKDGGSMIAGSIENLKQSTNLSEFIEQVARKESSYNSELAYYKTAKNKLITQLFSAFFVSDEINTLPFVMEPQTAAATDNK